MPALLLLAALLQQNLDTVQVRSQQVSPGVYMLTGAGGNIGVSIGDDAVFVVDDQYAPLTPKILAAIAELTPRPVRFVLNTHWHFDHTGGNEEMGKAGALLVALPVVTFSDTVTFHINGDEVRALHVRAAHTDGDAFVLWRKANVVHAGDVYVTYGYPFIDLSSGGSIDGLIAAIDVLLTLGDDAVKIIPGHGQVSDRAAVREFRHMLGTVRDRVRQQLTAGRTLADVVASRPAAEFDERWGRGFVRPEQFVEIVYRSLGAGRR